MNEILERIRIPSLFMLLMILNLWFFYTIVFDDRPVLMYGLLIFFFFFSIDYNGIRREYLCWLLLFIGIAVVDFNSHKLNVLTPLVLMQCVSRINIRTYLSYNVLIMGATALILFLTEGMGRMTVGGVDVFIRTRHDFGFAHPNVATMYYWGLFMSLILSCYLSKYRNFLWHLLFVIFIASVYLYSETISRGFITTVVIFISVMGYYSVRSTFNKQYVIGYSKYILYSLPLLLTTLTVYLSLHAKEYVVLDLLLSQRLSLYGQFLNELSPIQYLIGTTSFDAITVDSSYLHLLFESGVLLYVYFMWLYYFAIKNSIKQQNFVVIAIFVSFQVYGLVESLFLLPMIIGNNLFWVILYRYREGEDKELDPKTTYID
ncbi:MAG: hypothetical protein RL662_2195 [Bacteroidota bacterium]|jgi:hypothetical protein